MNRRTLVGLIVCALALAGLTFGIATFAAGRSAANRVQAEQDQRAAAVSGATQHSDDNDVKNKKYTDDQLMTTKDSYANSIETSQVVTPLIQVGDTGSDPLLMVGPDTSGASVAAFNVPVSMTGELTVHKINSGDISMPSGNLTVGSIAGANNSYVIKNNGNATFASLITNGNAQIGQQLSVNGSQTTLEHDFYAYYQGLNSQGQRQYLLQVNTLPNGKAGVTVNGDFWAQKINIVDSQGNNTGITLNADGSINAKSFVAADSIISNGTLTVAKASSLADLTVSGATNMKNATVDGALGVTGNATLNNDLSVGGTANVAGDTTVGGKADVAGNASVGGNADIKGNTTVGGNTDVTGNASVGGDTTLSGALTVAKTVEFTGATHLLSTLSVDGDTTLGKDGENHKTTVNGDLETTGKTTVGNGLDVNAGDTNLQGTNVNGNLNASGDTVLGKDGENHKTTVNGDLETTGKTTVGNGLDVSGDSNLQDANVSGTLNVDGSTTLGKEGESNATNVNGKLTADDIASKGTLTVAGILYGADADTSLQVTGAGLNTTGQIAGGSLAIGSDYGFSSLGDITGGSLTVGSDYGINDQGVITGSSLKITGAGGTVSADNLIANSISTGIAGGGTLTVADDANVTGKLIVGAGLDITGDLTVNNDDLKVQGGLVTAKALTINGSATFNKGITVTNGAAGPGSVDDGSTTTVSGDALGSVLIVTPTSEPQGTWWVEGHTVHYNSGLGDSMTFNYFSVNDN